MEMLESQNCDHMQDTPMHTDSGNVFEIVLRLPVLKKKSDFLWFYTKIQILCFKESKFNFLSGLEVH